MRRKAERGSAIRRAVNYSLLLSVSAGMPEIEAPLSLEARVAHFRQEPRVKLGVKLCHIE